jgi:hypothetical protein
MGVRCKLNLTPRGVSRASDDRPLSARKGWDSATGIFDLVGVPCWLAIGCSYSAEKHWELRRPGDPFRDQQRRVASVACPGAGRHFYGGPPNTILTSQGL